MRHCTQCGAATPDDARFCPRCGAPVIAPSANDPMIGKVILERFRREATTVAGLENEHILQVLDYGRSDDNRLFFAMEFLEGETLTKVVERERQLTIERTVDILTQICEGLIEAHGLGYVH